MNDEQQIIEPVPTLAGYKKIPTFKLWVANQFPYIETDFDAITNYELLNAVIKYLNTIIENENNIESNVTALYNSFVNLHDYVENYFDNLDVQDEINNKLDDLVEDGTLTRLIGEYVQPLLNKKPYYFSTLAEMKSYDLKSGDYAITEGYYEANDGGAGQYEIVDDDTLIDDGGSIIELENGLKARLIINNDEINIKQFGANGTVINDTKALQRFANSNIKRLTIPAGNFKLNDIIDLSNKELIGIGNPTIDIVGITTQREHTIHVGGKCTIKGINFTQTIANTNIIGFFNSKGCLIENCSFKVDDVKCNGYFDLYTDNHNIKVLNCNFDCLSTEIVENVKVNAIGGIWIRQFENNYTSDNIVFENCKIFHQSKDEAISIWNNRTPNLLSNVRINNCIIEGKEGNSSPNFISINANNSSINNCIINQFSSTNTSLSTVISGQQKTAKSYINNCIISTNIVHVNGIISSSNLVANNCVINDTALYCNILGNDTIILNSTINCETLNCQGNDLTIKECVFNINAQSTDYTWCFRKSIELTNNKFDFKTTTPSNFIYVLDNNLTFKLFGNTFNSIVENRPILINFGSHTGCNLIAYQNNNMGQINSATTNSGIVSNNNCLVTLNTFNNIKMNNNFNINQ